MLQALDAVQPNYMRIQRSKSFADKANFSDLSKLHEITVPKLTNDNYEIFTTAFYYVVGRNISMNRIPIDDVMRGVTGKYKSTWKSWEDKLNNFLLHTGDYFNNDNTTLY